MQVAYVVNEWRNSEGKYRQEVGTILADFMHYDKWNGLLTELLEEIELLQSQKLLVKENRFPTSVQILSWQFPIPGKEPITFDIWKHESVIPVLSTEHDGFQEWLTYQHFPPNPDEPNQENPSYE